MKLTVDINLTPAQIAKAFCDLIDEDQAQVFIEIAKIAEFWPGDGSYQFWLIGRHLKTCSCATDGSRAVVAEIYGGMTSE